MGRFSPLHLRAQFIYLWYSSVSILWLMRLWAVCASVFPSVKVFSSVQSLSRVQLFATPWIAACQASHPAISSSVIPFSSCPQSLPASESFPMNQLFARDGQSTEVSALASFLPFLVGKIETRIIPLELPRGHLYQIRSDQISHSVVSNSLQPHESQHARPRCPSPTPGLHPNSCASSQWCHPAISSSVIPFSSCPQSLPASESFPMSQLFTWGGQSIGVSASARGVKFLKKW